jgi:hypothetical protein
MTNSSLTPSHGYGAFASYSNIVVIVVDIMMQLLGPCV